MKYRKYGILFVISLGIFLLGGCGAASTGQTADAAISDIVAEENTDSADPEEDSLPDGVYEAEFQTDSSMFHVNETKDGKGELTVEDGQMTIHVTLQSKNIVNLYAGLAEDAQKEGAELIEPTVDVVTYSDGMEEEVYGFDIPVPYLDEEFDVALIGTHENWYDHKVTVSVVEE